MRSNLSKNETRQGASVAVLHHLTYYNVMQRNTVNEMNKHIVIILYPHICILVIPFELWLLLQLGR